MVEAQFGRTGTRAGGLAGALVALGAALAAQNVKLNAPLARDHLDYVESFLVGDEHAVYVEIASNRVLGVRVDGSAAAVQLAELGASEASQLTLTPDGDHLLYRFVTGGRTRLFREPVDGSAPPLELSGPLGSSGDVFRYALAPGGTRVVYLADALSDGVLELFSRPADASAPAQKLNGALAAGGDVLEFRISPDGTRVVYAADQAADEVVGLFSVPIDGSGPAVQLDAPQPLADVQIDFRISPDAQRVVYRADAEQDERIDLWAVPIGGGAAPVKRSGSLGIDRDVFEFRISADGTRLVYSSDQGQDEVVGLYGVPMTGGAVVQLTPFVAIDRDVSLFEVGGTRVVYTSDQDVDNLFQLHSVPLDGSAPALKLYGPDAQTVSFELTPDTSQVLFVAGLVAGHGLELFRVPVAGGASPVRVSASLSSDAAVHLFRFSPDGTRVAYTADQEASNLEELFLVPLNGVTPPVKRSGEMVSGGGVRFLAFASDGVRLVYSAAQEAADAVELYGTPVGATSPPLKLNAPLPLGGVAGQVTSFQLTSDGTAAYYTASQGTQQDELWRVELGGPGDAVRVSGGAGPFQSVEEYALSPDGQRVLFLRGLQLFSVPAHGGVLPQRIPIEASVWSFRIAPDSQSVVFVAGPPAQEQLFSAAIDATGPALLLGPVPEDYRVTPDGERVVSVRSTDGTMQLYSIPLHGGPEVVLNAPLLPGRDVGGDTGTLAPAQFYGLSPDGQWVAYVADQDSDDVLELYAVPADRSAPPHKLSGPMVTGGDVRSEPDVGPAFAFSPDGATVVYVADQLSNGVWELFRVALGGGPAVRLNGTLPLGGDVGGSPTLQVAHRIFEFVPGGQRLVYMADQNANDVLELFSVPLDGSEAPRRVSADLAGGDVHDFRLSPSGAHLAYRVRRPGAGLVFDVLGGRSTGAGQRLLGELVEWEGAFAIAPVTSRALFFAHDADPGTIELHEARLDPSGTTTLASGPLVAGGDAGTLAAGDVDMRATSDGRFVVYIADQDTDDVQELFATRFARLEHGPRRR